MIVGGCRSVFPHLLTTKVQENRAWICRCVCEELQVAATAPKGVVLGSVTFLVSRLLESGKSGPTIVQAMESTMAIILSNNSYIGS